MIYEETEEISRTRKVITKRTCDICHSECAGQPNYGDWSTGREQDVIRVSRTTGNNWGSEGDYRRRHSVDICPGCWDTRLVPWLISQDVEYINENWIEDNRNRAVQLAEVDWEVC